MSDLSSPTPAEDLTTTEEFAEEIPSAELTPLPTQNLAEMSLWDALQFVIFRPGTTLPEFLKVLWGSESQVAMPMRSSAAGTARPDSIGVDFTIPDWLYQLQSARILDWEYVGRVIWLLLSWLPMLIGARVLFKAATDPARRSSGDYGSTLTWFQFSIMVYGLGYIFFARDKWLPWVVRFLPEEIQDSLTNYVVLQAETPDDLEIIEATELDETEEFEPPATAIYDEPKKKFEPVNLLDMVLDWFIAHWMRLVLLPVAIVLSWLAYDLNVRVDQNSGAVTAVIFTQSGLTSWLSAIFLWYIIFVVDLNGMVERIRFNKIDFKQWHFDFSEFFRWRFPYYILILIILLGGYFRLHQLDAVPPDMTSDHIEKLGDSIRVENGEYSVFFPNNGGREAFQMYVVKFVADDLGVGFNFRALKYASIAEGMLAIVLMFFMAKTMIGRDSEENERLGDWVGLAAAALLAISSWHTMISRLGLRIPLTPLATILATIFLIRAIRHNRRVDFIHMGMVFGIGMYWYQSDRMLPLMAIPVVALAVLFSLPHWDKMGRYIVSFAMAGIIALVIYLPMYRYSVEFPGEFWSRGYGRIFGDFVYGYCDIDETTGRYIFCGPTTLDVVEHLWENRGAIQDNYQDAFLMFGWQGDPGWFHNGRGYPALDPITNALLMLGTTMWLFYALQKRKVIHTIVPIGIVVMMIPSILAIATTANENPAFTRISGIIPFVFLLAAFPIGVLANEIVKAGYARPVFYAPALLVGFLFINSAIPQNYENYFTIYRESYEISWKPYNEIAAPLQNFAEGEGSYGNAFYIHTAHWLDHRIVGAMAGDINWPNTVPERDQIFQRIRENEGTAYEYDPEKPLMFMINRNDALSLEFYQEHFPGGDLRMVKARNNNDFYVYTVPGGYGWIAQYATKQTQQFACITNCGLMR